MNRELSFRVTGFITSLVLTLAAYFIILNPEFFNFDIKTAVISHFYPCSYSVACSAHFFYQCLERRRPSLEFRYFYFHRFYHLHRNLFFDLDNEPSELQYALMTCATTILQASAICAHEPAAICRQLRGPIPLRDSWESCLAGVLPSALKQASAGARRQAVPLR